MSQIGRRYLVHIRIGATKPVTARLEKAAAGVKQILESLVVGAGNFQLAYISHDAASFGFFLKTTAHASTIKSQLESPGATAKNPEFRMNPPLAGEDSILVVEVGDDFSSNEGFGKARTWLQHH